MERAVDTMRALLALWDEEIVGLVLREMTEIAKSLPDEDARHPVVEEVVRKAASIVRAREQGNARWALALSLLGELGTPSALQALEDILNDKSVSGEIRAVAVSNYVRCRRKAAGRRRLWWPLRTIFALWGSTRA